MRRPLRPRRPGSRVPARRGEGRRPALGIDAAPAADPPEDATALLAFYRRLSPDSLYFRFFSLPKVDAAAGRRILPRRLRRPVRARRRDGRAHRGGRALLPSAPSAGPRRGRLHRRGRPPGPGRRDAPPRAAGRDRARPRHHDASRPRCSGTTAACSTSSATAASRRGSVGSRAASRGSCSRIAPTPAYEEHAADRSARAALRLDATALRAVASSRSSERAAETRQDRRRDLPQPPRDAFAARVVPDQSARAARSSARRATRGSPTSPAPWTSRSSPCPRPASKRPSTTASTKGVSGVVVITAGFSETGAEGRRREAALLSRRSAPPGIRMVGPNCMGLVNTDPRVPSQRDVRFRSIPPRASVALSSQSGALGPRSPRLRLEAQPRHLDVRLGRQQGRRLGQRPHPVLVRGPAHRGDPPVPRELRQSRSGSRGSRAASRGASRSSPSSPAARRRALAPRPRIPGRWRSRTGSSTRCSARPA